MHFYKYIFICILVVIAIADSTIKQKCPEEEMDGYLWPSKSIGESALYYCNGSGYYRRICLAKKTQSGIIAHWSRLINMCKCKGDDTWKETPAGQYAYIPCPGAYEGYIGRFCTMTGEWGSTKDLCYLPDGQEINEFEVEL